MKINKTSVVFPVALILLTFVIAIFFYYRLPPQIATHWGINGQADGYTSKLFGLFFMPVLSVFLLILLISLPQFDPYKKNFDQFKNYFQNFINLVFAFFFYIYIATIVWNLGLHFNMIQIISPAFSILFYYIGVLMAHAKQNWFVGFRTPWTMSSVVVWDKTHKVGSKLFKATSLISLLSLFLPDLSIFFILIPIIFVSIFVFAYSYIEFKKTVI